VDSGQLLQERLTIDIVGDQLLSVRETPDETSAPATFQAPDQAMLKSYEMAIWDAQALLPTAARGAAQHLVGQVRPLAEALAAAVPLPVRDRIASAAGRLAAVELTLTQQSLEKYPWELIGTPGLLSPGDVTVWRTVMTEPPKPKPWGHTVLLTGSEAMLTGATYVHQELDMITSALAAIGTVKAHPEPALVISALRGLLDRHRPSVFHLAAHGTRDDLRLQNQPRPTLEDLALSPGTLAADLRSSRVKVALLNCCDSATPSTAGGRPVAYQIADQAGAAVIGMAGKIPSYPAARFGQVFHTSLASGRSTVEAYFRGVRAIRGEPSCTMMWSLPVMYSTESNVRYPPFPATDEMRARASYQDIERHLKILVVELAELAGMSDCEPSRWAQRTAAPKTRIEGIAGHIPELTPAEAPDEDSPTLQQQDLQRTCRELRAALRTATGTLSQLSTPGTQPRTDRGLLRLRRAELRRHLQNLQLIFEEAS
jgi:hypothetical protein